MIRDKKKEIKERRNEEKMEEEFVEFLKDEIGEGEK